MTIFEYIAKMKSLANEMAVAGKALVDEELAYIMVARVEPISVGKLYAQLLSFEAR
jgi:hypothetical protein